MRLRSALLALTAIPLAGCVVEGQPTIRVQQSAPVVQQKVVILNIAGVWALVDRNEVVRQISVRRTQGGILVTNANGREFFAERIAIGAFRDRRGRVYQFSNDFDGVFDNPNNGNRFRLRRVQ